MGCFAKGCLTILILGFLFIAVVVGGGWYLYKKTLNNLTATAPADVRLEAPTQTQIQAAEQSKTRLDEAIAKNRATTVEFTGPQLNALLARDPELSFWRDRGRIDIANSIMTVTLSTPLDVLPWPGLKERWFNGMVRFGMAYASGTFQIDVKSVEANGHELPGVFLSRFNSSFNEGMNKGFQDEVQKSESRLDYWGHVKSLSLAGDKLVVTTEPTL